MKFFVFALAFSIGIFSARGESQAELNAAALQKFQKAEADLQGQCKALIEAHSNDPAFAKHLEATQKSWLAYVQSHLQTVFPLAEGENPPAAYGASYPMELALLKSQLYKQRIDLLSGKLDSDKQPARNASKTQEVFKIMDVSGKTQEDAEQAFNKLSADGWNLKTHVIGDTFIFSKAAVDK